MGMKAIVEMQRNAFRRFIRRSHNGYGFVATVGFIREIEAYISAHEAAGISLDTWSQDIRYDDRLVLTLKKIQGVWYITDLTLADIPIIMYLPVYIWKRVKLGAFEVCARVLNGWQYI